MSIYTKLCDIHQKVKVPKNRKNDFGNFQYRSAEDIMKAVKKVEPELHVVLIVTDDAVLVGNRNYIKATARLIDTETGESIETCAFAREPENPKAKMDESQTTGSASSYARKYALSALLSLDDSIDPDSNNAIDSGEPCTDAQEKTIKLLAEKYNVNLEKLYKQQKVKGRPTGMQAAKIMLMFKQQLGADI